MMLKIKQLTKKYVPSVRKLKVMALIRLLLGNYANISETRRICFLLKLYCIMCCAIIGYILCCYDLRNVHFLIFIEYILTAIVYLIYGDQRFSHFFGTITTNDRIIGFKKMPLITNFVDFIIIGTSLMRLSIVAYRTTRNSINIFRLLACSFAQCSIDANHLTTIVIFSILQSRMKKLRLFLKSNSIPINIIGRNEVAISLKNIRKCLYYYNNLLDNLQFVDKQLKYLLFIQWSFHFLQTTIWSYNLISGYFLESPPSYMFNYLLELAQLAVVMFCPAFFAEATVHEVHQIKTTLTGQILRCSDESLRWELQTALQYVSLRPFKYTLCRAVSLDVYLPFAIISLSITYVIVAFQLFHFAMYIM